MFYFLFIKPFSRKKKRKTLRKNNVNQRETNLQKVLDIKYVLKICQNSLKIVFVVNRINRIYKRGCRKENIENIIKPSPTYIQ